MAGPAHDARHARAAFPISYFAIAQGLGRPAVVAPVQRRAVVGGENDPGVIVQTVAVQRVQNLPDGPVNFLNHIAIKSIPALAAKFVAHAERHVRHIVREVEKEWMVFVLLNELYRALGIPGR